LNAIETFFSALSRRRLGQGVPGSPVEPQARIRHRTAECNDAPAPFV
jgi:hypothetical protein